MKFRTKITDRRTKQVIAGAEPFPTAMAAWRWLWGERTIDEDRYPNDVGQYSETWADLSYLSRYEDSYGNPHHDYGHSDITGWGTRIDGTGTIPGDTPARMNSFGETPDDDFGIDYTVERIGS